MPGGLDKFYDEAGTGWDHSFKLGPAKSALANLPADEVQFPVSTWLRSVLLDGVCFFEPDIRSLRVPVPPGGSGELQTDASNLAEVIAVVQENAKSRDAWLQDMQAICPSAETVCATERPEDHHRYVEVRYKNGFSAPSWSLSEGLLRAIAIAALVHRSGSDRILVLEEPETGLHPETHGPLLAALRKRISGQILLTSTSPSLLSSCGLEDLLCFSQAADGSTQFYAARDESQMDDWLRRARVSDVIHGPSIRSEENAESS